MEKIYFDPQERRVKAETLFVEGYNCCQSVMLAFSDVSGMDNDTLLRVSSGFGGGMGRMREVCGAVSGMVAMSGFIRPSCDPSDHSGKMANYTLVQELAAAFKEQKGSIVCRELLGRKMADHQAMTSPEPSLRTPEYYKTRPCAAMVGLAAEILANKLNEMNQ